MKTSCETPGGAPAPFHVTYPRGRQVGTHTDTDYGAGAAALQQPYIHSSRASSVPQRSRRGLETARALARGAFPPSSSGALFLKPHCPLANGTLLPTTSRAAQRL